MRLYVLGGVCLLLLCAVACAPTEQTAVGSDAILSDPVCNAMPSEDDVFDLYGHLTYGVQGFYLGEDDESQCVCTEFAGRLYQEQFDIDWSGNDDMSVASNWPDHVGEDDVFSEVDCDDAVPGDIVYYDRDYDPGDHGNTDLSLETAQETAHDTLGKHVAVVVATDDDGITQIADSSATASGVNVWDFETGSTRTYSASTNGDGVYQDGDDYVNWTHEGSDGERYRRFICLRPNDREIEGTVLSPIDGRCYLERLREELDRAEEEAEEPFDDVVPDPEDRDGEGGDGDGRPSRGGGSLPPGAGETPSPPSSGDGDPQPGACTTVCLEWTNRYYEDEDGNQVIESQCVERGCPDER